MMKQSEEEWRQSVKLNGTDTCYGSTRTDTPNKLNRFLARFVSVPHTAQACFTAVQVSCCVYTKSVCDECSRSNSPPAHSI